MSQGIWITMITYALLFLNPHLCSAKQSTTFTITNQCNDIIWPALLSTAGAPPWIPATGFVELLPGESKTLSLPSNWTGRLWGKTLCNRASGSSTTAGRFSCVTGDCTTSECPMHVTATTLAEFTLNGDASAGILDTYLVSLAHGFNLPMAVAPRGGTAGNCTESGCFVDLNESCPRELRLVYGDRTVGCRSICDAFGDCCTAAQNHGGQATSGDCKENSYSKLFGGSCPLGSMIFTCLSKDYIVTFCPSSTTNVTRNMSSDEFKSDEDYGNLEKKKKANTGVLLGFVIVVVILVFLAVVVFTVRRAFRRETNILERFNPEQCNCQCIVTCVKVG